MSNDPNSPEDTAESNESSNADRSTPPTESIPFGENVLPGEFISPGKPQTVGEPHPSEGRHGPPPLPRRPLTRQTPGSSLASLVATHNPFYAAATALVFYGVRISFPPGQHPHYSAWLAGSLAVFVALLVAAAIFLKWINAQWQDLRMVALLVVVMLPAISITFDDQLVDDPKSGLWYGVGGAAFASLMSEVLLRGLRVRLPTGYRVPYHQLLASFFMYPLLVRHFADTPDDPQLAWTMFGFAPLVCAILLACLPAVARGNGYVSQNGTPWGWPLYPTSIFVLLTVCAAGRTWYLCRSFHFVGDHEGVFGVYLLIPLVFAAAAWCAVGGIRTKNRPAQIAALALPLLAVAMATVDPGRDYVFGRFLSSYQGAFGALPPLATIVVAAAFYGVLWGCRVRSSAVLLVAALIWAAAVGPNSRSVVDFAPLHPGPLVAAAVISSLRAFYKRDLFWPGCATACWSLAAMTATRHFPGVPVAFAGYHTALVLAVAAAIGLGRERGRPFGLLASLLVAVAGLHALKREDAALFIGLPPAVADWYPLPLSILAFAYAWGMRDHTMAGAGTFIALGASAKWSVHGYLLLRPNVRGLDFIAAGLGCLAVAIVVSYAKAKRGAEPATSPGESTA
jgi:hypothetical protein